MTVTSDMVFLIDTFTELFLFSTFLNLLSGKLKLLRFGYKKKEWNAKCWPTGKWNSAPVSFSLWKKIIWKNYLFFPLKWLFALNLIAKPIRLIYDLIIRSQPFLSAIDRSLTLPQVYVCVCMWYGNGAGIKMIKMET